MEEKEGCGRGEKWGEEFGKRDVCGDCKGGGVKKEGLDLGIEEKNIYEVGRMEMSELYEWVWDVEEFVEEKEGVIGREMVKEIGRGVKLVVDVGVEYVWLKG